MLRRTSLIAAALVAFSLTPRVAHACAPAPPPWERISIGREDVLLVWDAARKVEHFVRRVDFRRELTAPEGKAEVGFGFLVPTPTKPELGETSDRIFETLELLTRPAVVHQPAYDVIPGCIGGVLFATMRGKATSAAMQGAGVKVLGEQRVAGLDASILEATDVAALETWLLDHGYPFRPALRKWVTPYIEAKWKITAFKYASPAVAAVGSAAALGSVISNTLRMSFGADRPFYLYREPEDTVATVFA